MIPPRYHICMKLITKNADYSIRAILYMAKKPAEVYSVSALSSKLMMPNPYLRKILQIMSSKGLLLSLKGKNGGFKLAEKFKELTIADVLSAFNADMTMTNCTVKKAICPNHRTCPLRKQVGMIEKDVLSKIRGLRIRDLMKGGRY